MPTTANPEPKAETDVEQLTKAFEDASEVFKAKTNGDTDYVAIALLASALFQQRISVRNIMAQLVPALEAEWDKLAVREQAKRDVEALRQPREVGGQGAARLARMLGGQPPEALGG